jgi:hypothetical protein
MIQHFHDLQTARAQMRTDALSLLEADPLAYQACQTILDVMTEFEVRAPDNDDADVPLRSRPLPASSGLAAICAQRPAGAGAETTCGPTAEGPRLELAAFGFTHSLRS